MITFEQLSHQLDILEPMIYARAQRNYLAEQVGSMQQQMIYQTSSYRDLNHEFTELTRRQDRQLAEIIQTQNRQELEIQTLREQVQDGFDGVDAQLRDIQTDWERQFPVRFGREIDPILRGVDQRLTELHDQMQAQIENLGEEHLDQLRGAQEQLPVLIDARINSLIETITEQANDFSRQVHDQIQRLEDENRQLRDQITEQRTQFTNRFERQEAAFEALRGIFQQLIVQMRAGGQ